MSNKLLSETQPALDSKLAPQQQPYVDMVELPTETGARRTEHLLLQLSGFWPEQDYQRLTATEVFGTYFQNEQFAKAVDLIVNALNVVCCCCVVRVCNGVD